MLEIKIKEGLNELKFGFDKDEITKLLGNPDEVETLEESDDPAEVWYYDEDGITVFFEESDRMRCVCLETDNTEITLFGKKLAEFKEADIEPIFRENNFSDFETENEAWGEKRITVNDAVVDIYFEDGEITAINWGVDFDEEGNPLWL